MRNSNSKGHELEKINEIIDNLKKISKEGFDGISDNYKQKLVYTLLNTVRARDKYKFIDSLSRVMAANMKSDKSDTFKKLAEKTAELQKVSDEIFMKYAYSIVLGIISSKNGEVNTTNINKED